MKTDGKTETGIVAETLRGPLVHEGWERRYRTADAGYTKHLFDMVTGQLGDPTKGPVLDAGCGPAVHALELARRGYTVHGIDSSPSALDIARANIAAAGCNGQVTVERGDLLELPFADAAYGRVMCWGVLMHVPRVEAAIAELVRVTAPGGVILVSENNLRSLQGRAVRMVKQRDTTTASVSRRPAGLEVWRRTEAGELLTRVADPRWLEAAFRLCGAMKVTRRPTSLTDVDTRLSGRAAALVRAINRSYFFTRWAGPALGNIFVFEKRNGS